MGRVNWLERGTKEFSRGDGNVFYHVWGSSCMSAYDYQNSRNWALKKKEIEHFKYMHFIAHKFYLKKKTI